MFAPESMRIKGLFIVGRTVAIAGLSIPGNLPIPSKLAPIAAPVEPAATTASELPVTTALTAITIDELRFFLIACPGASPISITSEAFVFLISRLFRLTLIFLSFVIPLPETTKPPSRLILSNSLSISYILPTSSIGILCSTAAQIAPSMAALGA